MIAILLLAPFLDIEVDPYRQFLWDRISSELKVQFKENLTVLQQLIYHLSAQQIQRSTEAQYALFLRLSQGDSLEPFEAELLNQCQLLSEDEHLQAVWLLLYELILRPTLEFYQSALLGLMMEFSDRFTLWHAAVGNDSGKCPEKSEVAAVNRTPDDNAAWKISNRARSGLRFVSGLYLQLQPVFFLPGRTAAGVAEAFAILSSLLCDGKSMRKSNLVLAEDRGAAIFDKQKERLE